MLNLSELQRCAQAIEARFVGLRLDRAVQADSDCLVLCMRGRSEDGDSSERRFLLLSCNREHGRASEVAGAPRAPEAQPAFPSYLRAHAAKARLVGAAIRGAERQLLLTFAGQEGEVRVLLSLMGGRSNLYALDADDVLRASLRPVEQSRRDLALGGPWSDPESRPSQAGEDRFAEASESELLLAVEAEYAGRVNLSENKKLAGAVLRVLRKERKRAEKRLAKLAAELEEAGRAAELQRQGDLLKTSLGRIKPGDAQIAITDPATGEEVVVPLDPALNAAANLQATFKRYQKFVRRLTKAGGQVDEAKERVAMLDEWLTQAAAAAEGDRGHLDPLLTEPEIARLLKKYESIEPRVGPSKEEPKLPKRLQGVATRFMPRRYRSKDGLEIWVGRSDAANDHLTTRLARGKDLFFHLDGAPGSHVILCTEGSTEVPPESILDACQLAVRFSKQKNASRADVHVVPIKQVKKPKGAKPGLVWVTGGRTVHLRCDDERLERLFASRLD